MIRHFESELPRDVSAPGIARRLLADWLAPALGEVAIAKAALMVSELVTNAVRHGHGTITLRADLSQARLHVEVADEGAGFQREARERDFEQIGVGGWGLSIIDAEAVRWGVGEGTSRVWFELRRPGPWQQSLDVPTRT